MIGPMMRPRARLVLSPRMARRPPAHVSHPLRETSLGGHLCRLALLTLLSGCGGGPTPQPEVAPHVARETTPPQAASRRSDSSMEVSGLIGTVSPAEVQRTMERQLGRFQRCFFTGMKEVPFLSGRAEFDFRIGARGTVTSVSLHDSSVGHLATEACLLSRAAAAEFPAPRGGDAAEFRWGFEIDDTGGVRPPVPWAAANLEAQRPELAALLETCGVRSATLTLYVNPGGQVIASGIASATDTARPALRCVADAATAIVMTDPGSYAAKVTLQLP